MSSTQIHFAIWKTHVDILTNTFWQLTSKNHSLMQHQLVWQMWCSVMWYAKHPNTFSNLEKYFWVCEYMSGRWWWWCTCSFMWCAKHREWPLPKSCKNKLFGRPVQQCNCKAKSALQYTSSPNTFWRRTNKNTFIAFRPSFKGCWPTHTENAERKCSDVLNYRHADVRGSDTKTCT